MSIAGSCFSITSAKVSLSCSVMSHSRCKSGRNDRVIPFIQSFMQSRGVRNAIHKSLVAIMTVWLSGFVFLFCCHAQMAENICPLMRLGAHCDKSQKAKDAERVE